MYNMVRLALLLLCFLTASPAFSEPTVTLNWNPNTESDLAGYKIYQSTISGQYGAPVATLGKVTTSTLALPQLTVDVTYFFVLTAYDLAGNESGQSNEVSKLVVGIPAVTKPGMPVLTVATQATELLVAWEPVSDGAGGVATVDVRLGQPGDHWGVMRSQPCPASPCTLVGMTPDTAYLVQAVAYRGTLNVDAVFGELSAVVVVSTSALQVDPPPANPTGLTIVSRSASEIVIVASAADCPRVITSTRGSTAATRQRTVTCRP